MMLGFLVEGRIILLCTNFQPCTCMSSFYHLVFLTHGDCQRINSTLLRGQYACPNQQVLFTCETNGSLIMAWSSLQYIGPSGIRLELIADDGVGHMVRSVMTSDTVATLTRINGDKVVASQLRITVQQNFPIASVSCIDAGVGMSPINFQILGMYVC